ncbi:MAG TPA: cupin domain-containing protein [Enteractinococcus sp.]
MITVTHRASIRMADSMTGLFTGADHQADVSFFWVDETPGGGPAFHWHPYTETWVVLDGQVLIETQNKQREIEQFVATPGDIVTVMPETIHRFRARGQTNLHMLCIHPAPRIIEEFIEPEDTE